MKQEPFSENQAVAKVRSLNPLCSFPWATRDLQAPPRCTTRSYVLQGRVKLKNRHAFMYPWNLGCRVAAISLFYYYFFLLQMRSPTTQPVYKVKSWVKLHSIYETQWGRKSMASHLKPLFMVSHTKPSPLPGCTVVLVIAIYALCSPKHK